MTYQFEPFDYMSKNGIRSIDDYFLCIGQVNNDFVTLQEQSLGYLIICQSHDGEFYATDWKHYVEAFHTSHKGAVLHYASGNLRIMEGCVLEYYEDMIAIVSEHKTFVFKHEGLAPRSHPDYQLIKDRCRLCSEVFNYMLYTGVRKIDELMCIKAEEIFWVDTTTEEAIEFIRDIHTGKYTFKCKDSKWALYSNGKSPSITIHKNSLKAITSEGIEKFVSTYYEDTNETVHPRIEHFFGFTAVFDDTNCVAWFDADIKEE